MGIPFVFAGSRKAAEYIVYSILTQYANGIRRRLRAVEAAMNPIQPPQTMPRARVVRMQTMAQAEGLWAHALSVGLRRRLVESGAERFDDAATACEDALRTAWPRDLDEPGTPQLGAIEEV